MGKHRAPNTTPVLTTDSPVIDKILAAFVIITAVIILPVFHSSTLKVEEDDPRFKCAAHGNLTCAPTPIIAYTH